MQKITEKARKVSQKNKKRNLENVNDNRSANNIANHDNISRIYFILTKNCNLKCSHCYLEAGPGNKYTTVSEDNFHKAIQHLPKRDILLWLSGGELFTIKDKLYSFLDYLKSENETRRRKEQGTFHITIQSNGFWGKNRTKALDILEELHNFGVEALDLSSYDTLHEEQGLNIDDVCDLGYIAESCGFFKRVYVRGSNEGYIMPVGRARNISLEEISETNEFLRNPESQLCKGSLDKLNFNIYYDGRIYVCCYPFFSLPGNIFEEDLETIVAKAKMQKEMIALNNQGIKGIVEERRMDLKEYQKLVEKHSYCGACYKMFFEGKV